MNFASTELAARLERAECQLLHDAAQSVAERRPEAQVYLQPIAGGLAAYTAPGSPLNKLGGLGFDGPVDEAMLTEIERVFTERQADLQVEVSTLADPSVVRMLSKRDYVLQGFENVLGCRLSVGMEDAALDGFEIEVSELDDLDSWVETVVSGFAAADTQGVESHESFPREVLEATIRDLIEVKGFARYTVRNSADARPAGGGSIRLHEGLAQLCGAATVPEFRRRGVQTALLCRRLADAERAGCDLAVVATMPGSKSHENLQRRGFELLYSRAMFVREVGS
ncbi:MAG: GNAT family N-acetyltransferase [Planctomycetota bacterium]|jgi:GNAT superfamily N-acetyltransferase